MKISTLPEFLNGAEPKLDSRSKLSEKYQINISRAAILSFALTDFALVV
jgi:hypothetical protein